MLEVLTREKLIDVLRILVKKIFLEMILWESKNVIIISFFWVFYIFKTHINFFF